MDVEHCGLGLYCAWWILLSAPRFSSVTCMGFSVHPVQLDASGIPLLFNQPGILGALGGDRDHRPHARGRQRRGDRARDAQAAGAPAALGAHVGHGRRDRAASRRHRDGVAGVEGAARAVCRRAGVDLDFGEARAARGGRRGTGARGHAALGGGVADRAGGFVSKLGQRDCNCGCGSQRHEACRVRHPVFPAAGGLWQRAAGEIDEPLQMDRVGRGRHPRLRVR